LKLLQLTLSMCLPQFACIQLGHSATRVVNGKDLSKAGFRLEIWLRILGLIKHSEAGG